MDSETPTQLDGESLGDSRRNILRGLTDWGLAQGLVTGSCKTRELSGMGHSRFKFSQSHPSTFPSPLITSRQYPSFYIYFTGTKVSPSCRVSETRTRTCNNPPKLSDTSIWSRVSVLSSFLRVRTVGLPKRRRRKTTHRISYVCLGSDTRKETY